MTQKCKPILFSVNTGDGLQTFRVLRQAREIMYWECSNVERGTIVIFHEDKIRAGRI